MLRVLLVEDSPAVRRSLGRLLGAVPGVDVVGLAEDVTGALSLFDATPVDAVVLDVNLLDGDRGIDVLRYVKRHRPRTEVIVLTNCDSQRLRDSYLDAGASAYFDKALEFTKARDWIADLSSKLPAG